MNDFIKVLHEMVEEVFPNELFHRSKNYEETIEQFINQWKSMLQ